MKFATISAAVSSEQSIPVIVLSDQRIVHLGDVFKAFCGVYIQNLNEFIRYSADIDMEAFSTFVENWSSKCVCESLQDQVLDAPIPYPVRDLICLGKNYPEHAAEIHNTQITNKDVPQYPIYFSKAAHPAIGTEASISMHKEVTGAIDYEVELAVVIGKSGRDIPLEQVEEYIFGYTVANDVSARDLQGRHQQWFKGKSLDGFAPMGPWIVHKSELPLPLDLAIKMELNDEVVQNSRTSQMVFDIPTMISDLSRGMTLRAGDILLTGTPAGTGMGYNPPRYLEQGDVMKCSIEGIGTLVNRMRE